MHLHLLSPTAALLKQRAIVSLTTFPTYPIGYIKVIGITSATAMVSASVAATTGFIHPVNDYNPPWTSSSSPSSSQSSSDSPSSSPCYDCFLKPLSAFIFPSFIEELFWRGCLLPTPSSSTVSSKTMLVSSLIVLAVHVASHPLVASTIWPRGRKVFYDPRFLILATIVLGGSTLSYIISGGSVWAATFTHGVHVMLWRDFFNGELTLQQQQANDGGGDGVEDSSPLL